VSEKEHAPTPWRAKDTDDGGAIEIYDAEGVYLFDIQMWGGEDGRGRYDDFEEAVAEKLIPRVNAHAALEAELAAAKAEIKRLEDDLAKAQDEVTGEMEDLARINGCTMCYQPEKCERLEAELATLRDFCEGVPVGVNGGLKKLVDALRDLQQTVRNLANGFLCGEASIIAQNASIEISVMLAQFEEQVEDNPIKDMGEDFYGTADCGFDGKAD